MMIKVPVLELTTAIYCMLRRRRSETAFSLFHMTSQPTHGKISAFYFYICSVHLVCSFISTNNAQYTGLSKKMDGI